MPEALEKIKVDLGKDAIILNTKPIKTGGFLGMFGKQQIEVIAAVDQKDREKGESARQAAFPMPTSSNRMAARAYQSSTAGNRQHADQQSQDRQMPDQQVLSRQSLDRAESVSHREEPILQANRTFSPAPQSASPERYDLPANANSSPESDREIGSSLQSARVVQEKARSVDVSAVEPEQARKRDRAYDDRIASELRDMREMFQKLLLLKESSKNLPGPILAIRDRLLEQGVEDEWVAQIMKKMLQTIDDPTTVTDAQAYEQAARIINAMLVEASSHPVRIDRSVRFAFFFGPTGVGKTTTIAKLAAEAMLKETRKVGFITSDTFRIAAVEQLKTYANILNVPLEVVFSPKEIEQAMERLADCDLVFVDTAGRNYRNDEYVKGIKALLQYGETTVNFLVMSLTTKYADMKAILQQFEDLPGGRAIFTKADETDAYGSIFNVTQEFRLPLSYITTGQNVPDDIILATPELVTTMIVGDETYA